MNEQPSKIYLLPNLMTAGNLFCGFTATLKILEGALLQTTNADLAADRFHEAIWFVLRAFVSDFLDVRIARLAGRGDWPALIQRGGRITNPIIRTPLPVFPFPPQPV